MEELFLGFKLMGFGLGGVFFALILFYLVIKLLLILPTNKSSNDDN